jgi:hypothetical protein
MSTTTQIAESETQNAEINKEAPTADVRYTFKTTEENKTENAFVSLTSVHRQMLADRVVQNGRWRSDGQYMVDAIVHYLNDDSELSDSPSEVVESTEWGTVQFSFAITETMFNEIDLMVNHSHTPWNTKQEFYICAIKSFEGADNPVVVQR